MVTKTYLQTYLPIYQCARRDSCDSCDSIDSFESSDSSDSFKSSDQKTFFTKNLFSLKYFSHLFIFFQKRSHKKLQMWQNSKCDKTEKLKMWQNSKTQNATILKNSEFYKTQKLLCRISPLLLETYGRLKKKHKKNHIGIESGPLKYIKKKKKTI